MQYEPSTDELSVYHNQFTRCLFTVDITQQTLDYINDVIQREENEQRTNQTMEAEISVL